MKIKYLLSGRYLADSRYLKNIIDLWPSEYNPPSIVNSLNQVDKSDIVITTGYLGMSYRLITEHPPSKIFILDNGLFSSPGRLFFRLLDGNLKTLLNPFSDPSRLTMIKKSIMNTASELDHFSNPSLDYLVFPWSIPIKKICEAKHTIYIDKYNSLLPSETKKSKSLSKKNAIALIDRFSNVPILRKARIKNITSLKQIPTCTSVIAPNSTLAFWGYWYNKQVILSEVNPFYSFHIGRKKYSPDALLDYSSKLDFQMRDIAKLINGKRQ